MLPQVNNEERSFFKRDISWLSFNYRVLMEAKDESLPLFERIKFLSIYSSNLEEFYRIRVSEHLNILTDIKATAQEREYAIETLNNIHSEVGRQLNEFDNFFKNEIRKEMVRHRIILYEGTNVEEPHKEFIRTYFIEEVFPYLEPMIILPGMINSFIRDNRLYMIVGVREKKGVAGQEPHCHYFIMKVPYTKIPRFVELPQIDNYYYLMFVEDIIKMNLDYIFKGYDIDGGFTFRVSRDADFMIPLENRQNIVEEIRKKVRKRKIGDANRIVYDAMMPECYLDFLCEAFSFSHDRCISEGSHLNLEDLIKLPNPIGATLTEPVIYPLRIRDFDNSVSIFKVVKKKDMLLQFPYQSFEYVIRFLNDAAFDPGVEEIKLTQYRVAENSDVINSLISAARNGKNVTVFVELKARFDEENNFANAEKMRKAGIKIIYSLPGLKVHSKMILVLRKQEEYGFSKSYACLSTGNFNEKTARLYSDLMIITQNNDIISEVATLFEILETGIRSASFRHILVSQFNMVDNVRAMVNREIDNVRAGKKGRIILKMNGIHDQQMIDMLYDASIAGVEIDLIVRGICCLVPNKSYSKNIKVTRIVDSYLEHSRVWYFYADGREDLYITSADWMKRNLNRRVETAFPVYDTEIKREIMNGLMIQISDNVKACWIDENMSNIYKKDGRFSNPVRAQRMIYENLKNNHHP